MMPKILNLLVLVSAVRGFLLPTRHYPLLQQHNLQLQLSSTTLEDHEREKHVRDVVPVVKARQKSESLYDLAVAKNLPKKQKSSPHSMLSSLTAMAAAVTLLPTFAPGMDEYGLVQIFQYSEHISPELITQSQFCAVLQVIGALLGILRIPKNSPRIRDLGMKASAYLVTATSMVAISSLNGTDQYLLDAFSIPGKIIFAIIAAAAIWTNLNLVDCAISDKNRKGFDSVPLMGNRLIATLQSILVYAVTFLICQEMVPLLIDRSLFDTLMAPYYTEIYNGALVTAAIGASLFIGLGALMGTLQFEKKVSPTTSSAVYAMLGIFLSFDSFKLTFEFFDQQIYVLPQAQGLLQYIQMAEHNTHTLALYIGMLVVVVLNALRKLWIETNENVEKDLVRTLQPLELNDVPLPLPVREVRFTPTNSTLVEGFSNVM